MLKHNVPFFKVGETQNNDVMIVHKKIEYPNTPFINPVDEMVVVINVIPRKGQTRKNLDITFSSKYVILNLLDCPL